MRRTCRSGRERSVLIALMAHKKPEDQEFVVFKKRGRKLTPAVFFSFFSWVPSCRLVVTSLWGREGLGLCPAKSFQCKWGCVRNLHGKVLECHSVQPETKTRKFMSSDLERLPHPFWSRLVFSSLFPTTLPDFTNFTRSWRTWGFLEL